METREWTFKDRSRWPSGPWDGEPDKRQWTDETTGLPCLIVRNHSGSLCGYVGVSEGHPVFGVGYSTVEGYGEDDAPAIVPDLNVHGGLTFSDFCSPDEKAHGICHVVEPGENDRVWWLGFDCAHAGDISPFLLTYSAGYKGDTYRDLGYVTAECERLAARLAEVA